MPSTISTGRRQTLCGIFLFAAVVSPGKNLTRRRRRRRQFDDDDPIINRLLHPRHSLWQPHRAPPCNTTQFVDVPDVSALIQAFGDGANARQLATRLHTLPHVEIIVNDDSGSDHAEWLRWLTGQNDVVMTSHNVHEIRAYNRMARMARGKYLLLLQADHCLPTHGSAWLQDALNLFEQFPRLGLVGGQMGFNQIPTKKVAEAISWGVAPCKPIPTEIISPGGVGGKTETGDKGTPFMFVAGVNIGPLLTRREAFLRVGGFDEAFSCPGEPGIQLDTELSLQMWRHGYQVGLWYSGVTNGVGGRKTRSNKAQKRARARNDALNGQRFERVLREHNAAEVISANEALSALAQPHEVRQRAFESLGSRAPHRCST